MCAHRLSIYMYIHIYIYTCIYIYIHIYIYIFIEISKKRFRIHGLTSTCGIHVAAAAFFGCDHPACTCSAWQQTMEGLGFRV